MKRYEQISALTTNLVSDVVNLFYPILCYGCGRTSLKKENNVICIYCQSRLPFTNFHRDPENAVARNFWGRVPILHAASYCFFRKGSHIQQLMFLLKYQGKTVIAERIGMMYAEQLKQDGAAFLDADIILPVPLHYKKKQSRGYNQSDFFALGLSDRLNIPWSDDTLIRKVETSSQTKKGRIERWENVSEIFSIKDASALENKHIILVDDVVTTGATLEACAQVLIDKANARISVLTIASA